MSGLALARLDGLVQRRQIEPIDEPLKRAQRMILRNQIIQRRHLHSNLAAFWHPQPRRTARFSLRSLLLGQILKQLLVSHRRSPLRPQCERITLSRPWQMLVAKRFSRSEERSCARLEGWPRVPMASWFETRGVAALLTMRVWNLFNDIPGVKQLK